MKWSVLLHCGFHLGLNINHGIGFYTVLSCKQTKSMTQVDGVHSVPAESSYLLSIACLDPTPVSH